MHPLIDTLPLPLSRELAKFNIRFVEQFIALMRKPGRADALAQATGCPVEDLRALAQEVEIELPDLTVPRGTAEHYGLGAGKRADWERFGQEGQ